jgi:hypothetical protein
MINLPSDTYKPLFSFLQSHLNRGRYFYIARIILEPFLILNVTSLLFERYIFKYHWINPSEYQNLMNFFFKGEFIVPLTLFITIYLSFLLTSQIIYYFIENFIVQKILEIPVFEPIDNIDIWKNKDIKFIEDFDDLVKYIKEIVEEGPRNINFVIIISFSVIIFYNFSNHFNAILFWITIIFIIIGLIGFWIFLKLCQLLLSISKSIEIENGIIKNKQTENIVTD